MTTLAVAFAITYPEAALVPSSEAQLIIDQAVERAALAVARAAAVGDRERLAQLTAILAQLAAGAPVADWPPQAT